MNEETKNIETCLPEDILAEVANVPTDAQFVSLVNESLDPLKQQAVEQAGSDAYEQVVESHKPYTFTSTIVQMKSNLILLLRRLWRFQFGTGTLLSLADMWSHYITRLSGNAEYGIPSRLDQLTALPSAPLLVADRKISEPNAIDGISLAQILCNATAASAMTKLEDTNHGWIATVGRVQQLCSLFPELEELRIGLSFIQYSNHYGDVVAINNTKIKRVYFTDWVKGNYTYEAGPNILSRNSMLEEIHAEVLEEFSTGGYPLSGFTTGETNVEGGMKIFLNNIKALGTYFVNTDNLRSVTANVSYVLVGCRGAKTQTVFLTCETSRTAWNTLLDVEIGDKEYIDMGLSPRWMPCQNITIGPQSLTAENMYNHILCRLKQDEAGCGSGVTITLGTTNIEKLEAVEEYNTKLTELEDTYGYTFA